MGTRTRKNTKNRIRKNTKKRTRRNKHKRTKYDVTFLTGYRGHSNENNRNEFSDNDALIRYFVDSCESGNFGHFINLNNFLQENQEILHLEDTNEILSSGFTAACINGHLHIAQDLFELSEMFHFDIDISNQNEYIFRFTCANGHLNVAQWLLYVKPNINIYSANDYAFNEACRHNHINVALWLESLAPIRYFVEINPNTNKIKKYGLRKPLTELDNIMLSLGASGHLHGPNAITAENIQDIANQINK